MMRKGRPRLNCVNENCKWMCKSVFDREWDPLNENACIRAIIEGAWGKILASMVIVLYEKLGRRGSD